MSEHGHNDPLIIRPYQALCLICSFGEHDEGPRDGRLKEILEKVRVYPDRPVALQCNAGDVYAYQDPGTAEDTPEGGEFNRKRDLDILVKLDLPPGSVLPARTLLKTVIDAIPTVPGVCGYDTVTAEAWHGCPGARSGCYERGREKGIEAMIRPRDEAEMAKAKEESLKAMYEAASVAIRPHILLCAVCQYGGGTRPPFKPDNLPELLQHILKNPDTKITMAERADWMMCAPCPNRVPELNACVNVLGSGGLSNQKRDLDVLQILGLTYGSTMPAHALYRLIFEKIPSTQTVCGRSSGYPSVWWDTCAQDNRERGNPNYEKGRAELMQALKLSH